MCPLWVCVNFLTRQVCWFLSQELVVFSSLWCLLVVLQVLWSCIKPLSFLLFSAGPRHLRSASSISALSQEKRKPVPWAAPPQKAGMLDPCFIVLFPSQGRSHELGTFSRSQQAVLVSVCGRGDTLVSPRAMRSLLFSVAPRHPHSGTGKTETSLLGSPLRSWNVGCMFHSFPLKGEAGSWTLSPDSELCLLGGRADAV